MKTDNSNKTEARKKQLPCSIETFVSVNALIVEWPDKQCNDGILLQKTVDCEKNPFMYS